MSTVSTYAPFPESVPTHPLLIVDYGLIKAGDEQEVNKLWTAATKLGFWYLKNHGADSEVQGMFDMGAETMQLPLEEKMNYEQGDGGLSFGYKAAGANAVDAAGTLDTVEFINIAKDDAIAWPEVAHRTYPSSVVARMESTITPFVRKSLEVNNTLLAIFNEKLELQEGTLEKLHSLHEYSGSEARCIKKPPSPDGVPSEKAALGAHTDFGSLSFLHNRLGGLQVMVPGTDVWQYIKPLPGHAVCNVGDALAIMSGGILRSNLHRVVSPPGDQAKCERWSVVFFTRPGNSVVLHALKEESPIIAKNVSNTADPMFLETDATASAWFARRIKNQRANNRTGPETWYASRGTEHQLTAF